MSLDQRTPIPPMRGTDSQSIKNTFATLQQNLTDLFQSAHEHNVRTSAPLDTDGTTEDIVLVNLDGVPYLYVKFPAPINWARVQLTSV